MYIYIIILINNINKNINKNNKYNLESIEQRLSRKKKKDQNRLLDLKRIKGSVLISENNYILL